MVLQESLEEGYRAEYPTNDDGIHPDFFKPCITVGLLSTYYDDVLGVKGASGESAPSPLKLHCSVCAKTPQTSSQRPSVAPCTGAGAAAACGDGPVEGRWQRSQRAHRWQINLVVLDEGCAVVSRNRTAIQLPAEFHLRAAFRGTGKSYDREPEKIHSVYT